MSRTIKLVSKNTKIVLCSSCRNTIVVKIIESYPTAPHLIHYCPICGVLAQGSSPSARIMDVEAYKKIREEI